jgi:GNAT superfamily N-acetyltransferase
MTLQAGALSIRTASPNDAAMLATLGARLFHDAFAADNRPEDLAAHLASTFGPELQARELDSASMTYLVAEMNGQPAGYALVSEGEAPHAIKGARPIELARLYVDRAWHGAGVAQSLMTAAEAEARRRGADTLWLGVWERNARAIAFYTRCGFRDVGNHVFYVGSDAQHDRLMQRDLAEAPIAG